VGTCLHSPTRALVRSDSDVGRLGVPIHPKCAWWGWGQGSVQAVKSSTSFSTNHFCMDLTLCMEALSCWNRRGPSPNCCHKVGSAELSRMSSYDVALRFPFTGPEGPEPWKTAPDHYSSSTKLYSWPYALGQVVFSWHPPNPDSSITLPDGEERLHCSKGQWRRALHHSSRHLALRMVILALCAAARP
jgi:hypothetical protein